eukprot:15359976-Ditylum_brightwellii.AAC.1
MDNSNFHVDNFHDNHTDFNSNSDGMFLTCDDPGSHDTNNSVGTVISYDMSKLANLVGVHIDVLSHTSNYSFKDFDEEDTSNNNHLFLLYQFMDLEAPTYWLHLIKYNQTAPVLQYTMMQTKSKTIVKEIFDFRWKNRVAEIEVKIDKATTKMIEVEFIANLWRKFFNIKDRI